MLIIVLLFILGSIIADIFLIRSYSKNKRKVDLIIAICIFLPNVVIMGLYFNYKVDQFKYFYISTLVLSYIFFFVALGYRYFIAFGDKDNQNVEDRRTLFIIIFVLIILTVGFITFLQKFTDNYLDFIRIIPVVIIIYYIRLYYKRRINR